LTLSSQQAASQASAANIAAFSTPTLLAQYLRPATSVSLNAVPAGIGDPNLANGSVSIQTGAGVIVDPLGSINIASVGGVKVDGALIAPGGTIALTVPVPPSNFALGYRSDLLLAVGPTAVLDVSGLRVLAPTDTHPLAGRIVAGGTVSLAANR